MSNIFKSASLDQKKRITIIAIYATIAVIMCLLAALLITQIVNKDNSPALSDDETGEPAESYTSETVSSAQLHSGSLILVNKNNEYIFADNPDVVSFPTSGKLYGIKDGNLKANQTALTAFNNMMKDAYSNISDANIVVMTAYRSADEQTKLNNGTPAGYSDFHTGMSFELKDGNTWAPINADSLQDKYQWLYDNAHKYGFIVRYPDDIPTSAAGKNAGKSFSEITGVSDYAQVFRYVGVAHATYIKANNLCLEEYLELLRTTYSYQNPLSVRGADGRSYLIYYAEAEANDESESEIKVSSKYGSEISGDNMNGYIVTVNKSTKPAVKNSDN